MPNEPMSPEALDRLEKDVAASLPMHRVVVTRRADLDALVRSYRAMESELEATRHALESHIADKNSRYAYTLKKLEAEALELIEQARKELSEARAEEARKENV